MRRHVLALLAAALPWLAGCDQLGIESASQVAARREAEGKAIGGACRHAARSIEACYEQNKRADKAAVFAGWREMNDYMRENKLEAMPAPDLEPAGQAHAQAGAAQAAPEDKGGDKAADKGAEKGAEKAADKRGKPAKVAAAKTDDGR
ncbi:MAG: hypothetical protein AMXMBFR66_27830 [Pseudomonadota bacterium]